MDNSVPLFICYIYTVTPSDPHEYGGCSLCNTQMDGGGSEGVREEG